MRKPGSRPGQGRRSEDRHGGPWTGFQSQPPSMLTSLSLRRLTSKTAITTEPRPSRGAVRIHGEALSRRLEHRKCHQQDR